MTDYRYTPGDGPDSLVLDTPYGTLKMPSGVLAPVVSTLDVKGIPTIPADAIVEGVGINTHFDWYNSNYGPRSAWATGLQDEVLFPAIRDLGIRHVRQGLSWTPDVPRKLKAAGLKSLVIDPNSMPVEDFWSKVKAAFAPADVWGICGVNEPGGNGGTAADAANAKARMVRLVALVRADAAWAGVKLLGPSLHTDTLRQAYGDPVTGTDYRDLHPYPGPDMPEASGLGSTLKATPGALQGVSSETGYHTNLADNGWRGVSETAAAIYLPRLVLDSLAGPKPVAKVYIYELLCHDLASETNTTEHALGLLAADGMRRAHYRSLQALLTTLVDPGPAFPAGPLDVKLSGKNPDLRVLPLARRDGSFDICLWRLVPVFDTARKVDLAVPDIPETLTFARRFRSAKALRVNDGQASAWVGVTSGTTMSLPVGAGVTILRVTP